jgi:CDP-diacylglycerol--serine O-phosphatidyltransferase
MIIISLAMVSRIPMFSLKFKNFDIKENFRRYVIIFAAIAFVIFNGISGLAWTIILYIVMSIALRNRQQTV